MDDRWGPRAAFIERAERRAYRTALLTAPIALLAVADLATGAIIGEPRIDVALLISTALGVSSAISFRRLASQLRHGTLPNQTRERLWARTGASVAFTVAVTAAVGYLIGGWAGAAGVLAVSSVLTAVGVAIGLRRRASRPPL